MMADIDTKLRLGWNPLICDKAPKAVTPLFRALATFLAVKEKECEYDTIRSYRSFVKTISTWTKEHGFTEDSSAMMFSNEAAAAFMDDIEARVSAKTFNNYQNFYNGLFIWLKDKGYTSINPFAGIRKKPKRLTAKTRRTLGEEELAKLYRYLHTENKEFLALSMLCYCCLIRPKEICLLRCSDLDLNNRVVRVRAEIAKNDKESFRTIPEDIIPYLERIDLSEPSKFLFGKHEDFDDFRPGYTPTYPRKISNWWNLRIRPMCDFDKSLQFYSLKDTGITDYLRKGIPINVVADQADHSSVAVTAIYVGRQAKAAEEIINVDVPLARRHRKK